MNYQDRVKHEQVDLQSKISSLSHFIVESPVYINLDEKERNRLLDQLDAMGEYNDILVERIENFK